MDNKQNDEDIMVQGESYSPEGEGYGDSGPVDTKVDEPAVKDDKPKETGNTKSLTERFGIGPIITFCVVMVVIIVTIVIIGSQSYKKKKEEEARLHAEELLQMEEEMNKFVYSDSEIRELRLAGYTGDEIENFEFEEIPAEEKIAEAEAEKQAKYDEDIAPYFDNASDEFNQLWNMTWLGQRELNFDPDESQWTYFTNTVNVDYEKLPMRGHQLYIKYYLNNGSYAFMTVSPKRFNELKDKGNIVLKIEYTKTGDGKIIITDAEEVIP